MACLFSDFVHCQHVRAKSVHSEHKGPVLLDAELSYQL